MDYFGYLVMVVTPLIVWIPIRGCALTCNIVSVNIPSEK